MNAQRQENPQGQSQGSMKGALVKSSLFHLLIFIVVLVGLPFAKQDPLIIAPVSVELVDISDVTETNKKPPPKPKPIPVPEKPKPIEPPQPPKEELKKPEPKPEPKKPDPVPPPKPKEEPKPKPEKPKEKPKPKKPKEEPKKQEDLFNSLLKDLTPTEEKPEDSQQTKDTVEPEDGQLADIANQMSLSELDALRAQIEPCWNVPTGAKYAEDLVVTLRLSMSRDATVRDVRVVNNRADSAFRAAADSAMRAVRNPRCSPFKLPPEKYEQWKTIIINFDPSSML